METAPLVVPTFDMAYLSLSSKSNFLLCCGGGGSANSGVLNQIQIVPVPSTGKTLGPLFSFGTDSKDEKQLCSGICCGIINVGVKNIFSVSLSYVFLRIFLLWQ